MGTEKLLVDGGLAVGLEPLAQRILHMIHGNKLRPGDQLPSENELARNFNAARGSVREALKALVALGVIETAAGKRARVCRIQGGVMSLLVHHAVETMQVSIQQTLDLRRTLEMRTARIAALCRTVADVERLQTLCAKIWAADDDLSARLEADIALHMAIAQACGNPLYETMIASFVLVMQKTIPVGWAARRSADERKLILQIHSDIVQAIVQQDPLAAEQAMAQHFDNTVQMLTLAGIS